MKYLSLALFVLICCSCNGQKRQWYLSDYGVKPNTGICYTDVVQALIDSAYALPGKTILVLDTGEYHFTTHTFLTKGRQDIWWNFGMDAVHEKRGHIFLRGCEPDIIFDTSSEYIRFDTSAIVLLSKSYKLYDSKGLCDSIGEDGLVYVCNRKKVPLGWYSDTTIWDDSPDRIVRVRVFYNRVIAVEVSFAQPKQYYWDATINEKILSEGL